jgi:uncharacterized membrane protein
MKSKTSAALLLFLTFVLGGIAGAVSYSLYHNQVAAEARRSSSARDPVNQMARALDLDAKQKQMLKQIMEESRDRYHALSQQMRPQYDAIRDESRRLIRQILREDQKARFEEFLRNLDAQRQRDRGPR